MSREVAKVSQVYQPGTLVEVTTAEGKKYQSVIVEDLGEDAGFIGRVLEKNEGIGVATWTRYGMNDDGRFQPYSQCKEIKVLQESTCSTKNVTISGLTENCHTEEIDYYETPLSDQTSILLCKDRHGYAGWSVGNKESLSSLLEESYFESYVSRQSSLMEDLKG